MMSSPAAWGAERVSSLAPRRSSLHVIEPERGVAHGETLQQVVSRWQRFTRDGQGPGTEWPVLDVLYNLLPWRGYRRCAMQYRLNMLVR
jgi:hypothetical protein